MEQILRTTTERVKNLKVPPEFLMYVKFYLKTKGLQENSEFERSFAEDMFRQMVLEQSASDQRRTVWTPCNEMQQAAIETEAFELYCGGRARAGKTDLLLGLAFTKHQNSIIFRTEYSQMEALEERSREILRGTNASYNASPTSKRWRNIPGNRTLKFGAIRLDGDIDKYYGRPHDLICFDEIPKFVEKHYLSVWGWACTAEEGQRVRIVCTGNPPAGSAGELWVKRRWAAWVDDKHTNPAEPGELRWYVNLDGKDTEVEDPDVEIRDNDGKVLKPLSRTFIPGQLLETKFIGEGYEATLDALPIELRSALRDGDFNSIQDDQPRQVISTEAVRRANERWEKGKPEGVPLRAVSVDVARGGSDQTIISKRYGYWYDELLKYKGQETRTGSEVASLVESCLTAEEKEKDILIVIDLAGVGASPYDVLIDNGFDVDGFNASTKSFYTDKSGTLSFANRRAEAWWMFKELIEAEDADIALPLDNELLADLTAPTWKLVGRGIQIESKDEIKKRLGRSPDCGDAVVMNNNTDERASSSYM